MLESTDSRHIAIVVGTRPEIVKLAPIIHDLGPAARFLHTCQHRDEELSGVFLAGAGLPQPEMLPGICSEPRHVQIGRMVEQLVSDSGGIQEECTVLKRPLIVVRNSTERPESIEAGFAHRVQPGPVISDLGRQLIANEGLSERLAAIPCPYGDGKASERIAELLRGFLRLGAG
jgi:UDP-N-acetylglucosamine 2-epimerase